MSYSYFFSYNVFGGILWVALFTFAGYFFGNIPFIRDHFSMVIIAIILISLIPIVVEAWRGRRKEEKAAV
jgi:membrane-associated protein